MFDKSAVDVLKQRTVLVAEDNANMRNLLRTLLEAMGFGRVVLAQDGQSALEQSFFTPPHLIITDAAMKPMDGFQLISQWRLQKADDNSTIPIIMLSGHLEISRVRRAKELGVASFLAKPVSCQTLFRHVMHAIGTQPSFSAMPTPQAESHFTVQID